jgi:hypothetical protein
MASKLLMASTVIFGMIAAGLPAVAQTASPAGSAAANAQAFMRKWDRSGKGLLGEEEVFDAAIVKFEKLDTDHQGRLTQEQLAYALTPQEFDAANPDRDTTIGAEEWFDLVHELFAAANPDHDGSLSVDELETPQGQALLKLVQ